MNCEEGTFLYRSTSCALDERRHCPDDCFRAGPSAGRPGQPQIGITIEELDVIVQGWSAKKDILNKPIFNDTNQRIGKVQDLIITPDEDVSFAIVGVGGFLGVGRHDVAIPVEQIDLQDRKFILRES